MTQPRKTFSETIEAVGRFDWEGLASQPVEYAQRAVKQALARLNGAEESIFHHRMRVLRIARQMELFKLDTDPEVGQPFVTIKRWIQSLWPESYRYCKDAWETEEALAAVPMEKLTQITGANLKVLADEGLSSGLATNADVLKAATERTKDSFVEYLNSQHGQHLEPVRLMPKVDAGEFERAVEMVQAVEECNRGEALCKIASLIIAEYAVPFERLQGAA